MRCKGALGTGEDGDCATKKIITPLQCVTATPHPLWVPIMATLPNQLTDIIVRLYIPSHHVTIRYNSYR